MAGTLKSVLSVTFGIHLFVVNTPAFQAKYGDEAEAKANEIYNTDVEKLKEAGFDLVTIHGDPEDIDDLVKQFKEQLHSRKWVGFNVGFGIRMNKDLSQLFEMLVNTALTAHPGIKILMTKDIDDVYASVKRNFPDDF